MKTYRLVVPLSVIAILALSGCGGASEEALTLADTKPPAQLLRNEAAGRIGDLVSISEVETSDRSDACEAEINDPEGIERRWRSTSIVTVSTENTDAVTIIDDVATTFAEHEWVKANRDGAETRVRVLTKENSTVELHLSALRDDDEGDGVAQIEIAAFGPCVVTAGAESPEVTSLESRD
jgi:hypothetical protein